MAEHDGSGERQSARTSQLCGAPVAFFTYGLDGMNLTHQPSWTNAMAVSAFQQSSAITHARANRVVSPLGYSQSSAGNERPMTIASAAPSIGMPSKGPLVAGTAPPPPRQAELARGEKRGVCRDRQG